jgi:hypothetical protein
LNQQTPSGTPFGMNEFFLHSEGEKLNDFGTSFRPDLVLNFLKLNFNVPIDGMMTNASDVHLRQLGVPGRSDEAFGRKFIKILLRSGDVVQNKQMILEQCLTFWNNLLEHRIALNV